MEMDMKKQLLFAFVAFASFFLLTGTNAFSANEETYSGRIVAINPRLDYFILKGPQGDRTFHAASGSMYTIDDQPVVLGELIKGDQVTVKVKAENVRPEEHVQNHVRSTAPQEFAGVITKVDPKDELLTVQGKNSARTFNTDRDSRYYINGEMTLFDQLEKGEHVTVEYQAKG
jgi:hypothetical protein